MVFGARVERQSKEAEEACDEKVHNVAAFPLAIPLMAGPGAITATVLLAGQAREGLQLLALIGVVAVVMVLCLGVFLLAGRIERMLVHRHQFDMREAHVLHIGHQEIGDLVVREPMIARAAAP